MLASSRSIEFTTVCVYLALMLLMAPLYRRQNKNIGDYFISGAQGTWWLVGLSTFMTSFSAFNFTGVAGIAYKNGWSALLIFIVATLGFLINAALFAPWFRQLRVVSAAQIIQKRFDPFTHQFFAAFLILLQLLFSAIQLYGLALFIAVVFDYDINDVILVVGAVVVISSIVGGSWMVMAADFVQGIALLPVIILAAILSLMKVGGLSSFFDMIDKQGLTESYQLFQEPKAELGYQFTYVWALALGLKTIIDLCSMLQAPRYFAAKDGAHARKAALLTAALTAVTSVLWLIPPITARLLYSDAVGAVGMARPEEAAYAIASIQLLPAGTIGLMVVAVLSSTMSSMDSGLNRNAAIFMVDIYPAMCRRLGWNPGSERRQLWLSQFITLLFGAVIVLATYQFIMDKEQGIFRLGLTLSTVVGFPLTIPMFLGMLVRRVPPWAASVTTAVTLIPSVLGMLAGTPLITESGLAVLQSLPLLQERWPFQQQALINFTVGTGTFFATMLFWGRVTEGYRQQVDDFFRTMTRPVDFAAEVRTETDALQSRTLGLLCLVVGACIGLLLLIPNDWTWNGRAGILFMSGMAAVTGTILLVSARPRV